MARMTINLPDELQRALKAAAARRGSTIGSLEKKGARHVIPLLSSPQQRNNVPGTITKSGLRGCPGTGSRTEAGCGPMMGRRRGRRGLERGFQRGFRAQDA